MKQPPHGFALGASGGKGLTSYFLGFTPYTPHATYSSTYTGRTNVPKQERDIIIEEAKIALLQLADKLPNYGPATTHLGQYARENLKHVSKISVGGKAENTLPLSRVFKELKKDLHADAPENKGQSLSASSLVNPERLERIREFFPQLR